MTTPYTGVPGSASAERTNPTVNIPADGDPGQASTFQPSLQALANEVAALKQKVAYLDDAIFTATPKGPNSLVKAWAYVTAAGAGPYTPASQYNVTSVTRTGSGASARLVVTFASAIGATPCGLIVESSGQVWGPDTSGSSTQMSFKYFGTITGYNGLVQDFNIVTNVLFIAIFSA